MKLELELSQEEFDIIIQGIERNQMIAQNSQRKGVITPEELFAVERRCGQLLNKLTVSIKE